MKEDLSPEAASRLAKPILSEQLDDIRRGAENEINPARKHLLEMLVVGYHADLLHGASLDCTKDEADGLRRKVLLLP